MLNISMENPDSGRFHWEALRYLREEKPALLRDLLKQGKLHQYLAEKSLVATHQYGKNLQAGLPDLEAYLEVMNNVVAPPTQLPPDGQDSKQEGPLTKQEWQAVLKFLEEHPVNEISITV
jgi:hypothetical protein